MNFFASHANIVEINLHTPPPDTGSDGLGLHDWPRCHFCANVTNEPASKSRRPRYCNIYNMSKAVMTRPHRTYVFYYTAL